MVSVSRLLTVNHRKSEENMSMEASWARSWWGSNRWFPSLVPGKKILSGLLKPWFVLFGTKFALYSSHDECFFGDNSQFKQELVLILGWNYPSVNLHSIRFELSGFLHQVDYTSAPSSFWIQLKYVIQPCSVSKWIGVNLISQNNPKHEITKSKITKIQIRSGPER